MNNSEDTNNQDIYLSVIAPAYNEVDNLKSLVEEICTAINPLNKKWELIIVNDCSEDKSLELLAKLKLTTPQLRVISLKRRSGQTAAVDAGFRCAKGEFAATLDSDLQNDPNDIPRLLKYITDGKADMVTGWRKDRNDPWIRLVSSRIANRVRNWLTHENINDSACGLKVLRRKCVANIKFFNGMHRFMPTLVKMEGYKVMEVPVNHRPRQAGVAKYGVGNRALRAFKDAMAVRWMQARIIHFEIDNRSDL